MDKPDATQPGTWTADARRGGRFRKCAAAALGMVLLLVVMMAAREDAPSHQGRSAEYWLREVFSPRSLNAPNPGAAQREAIEAFQQMGTNGVRFLVSGLEREDSAWNQIRLRFHPRLPDGIKQRIPEPVSADSLKSAAALVLLNVRDPQPDKTLARLVELLKSRDAQTRALAASFLPHYSLNYRTLDFSQYNAQMRSALGDTNYWIRIYAALTMLRTGTADSDMIFALSPGLTSGNITMSNSLVSVIEQLKKLDEVKE